MHILDIDLDFFQHGITHYPAQTRSQSNTLSLWDSESILDYLHFNCNVSKDDKIVFFTEHKDVYYYLLSNVISNEPITLTHIDAHSDLGYINTSFVSSDNYLSFIISMFNVHTLEMVYSKYSILDIPEDILQSYSFLRNKRIAKIKRRSINISCNTKHINLAIYDQNEYQNKKKADYVFITQSPNYTAINSFELISTIKKKMLTTAST